MIGVKATLHRSEDGQTVTRRFMAGDDTSLGYSGLTSKLAQLFPELSEGNFTIHLLDSNGDLVVATSDEEIFIALDSLPEGATLNIVIQEKATPDPSYPVCMTCGSSIRGHRYSCVVCADYDLCAPCEQAGRHAHHPVVRVTTNHIPVQTFNGRRTRLSDIGSHRSSPYFPEMGSRHRASTRQSLFDGPCTAGLFSCRNPAAFSEFHDMANNLIHNWCRAMPPPQSKGCTATGSTAGTGSPTGPSTSDSVPPPKYEKSDEFDPALFEQMMEEMTDNFNETMKNIGEKQKAEAGNPGHGQNEQRVGDNTGCDLGQMTDMLGPMVGGFVRAMGGDFDDHNTQWENCNNTKENLSGEKDPESQSAGQKRPRPPMKVVSQTESSSWSSHAGKQGEFTKQEKQTKLPHGENKKETTTTFAENTETKTSPDGESEKAPPHNGECKEQSKSMHGECKEQSKSMHGECKEQSKSMHGECKEQSKSMHGECKEQSKSMHGECNVETKPVFDECKQSTVPDGECEETEYMNGECKEAKCVDKAWEEQTESGVRECKNKKSPCIRCTKQTPSQLGEYVSQASRLEEYQLTFPKHAPAPATGSRSTTMQGAPRDAGCCVPGLCTDPPGPHGSTDPWSDPTPGTSRDSDCCVPGLCTIPPDLTQALLQLRAMGFTEEVGRLVGLLRTENGDIQRVIDQILPAPT